MCCFILHFKSVFYDYHFSLSVTDCAYVNGFKISEVLQRYHQAGEFDGPNCNIYSAVCVGAPKKSATCVQLPPSSMRTLLQMSSEQQPSPFRNGNGTADPIGPECSSTNAQSWPMNDWPLWMSRAAPSPCWIRKPERRLR